MTDTIRPGGLHPRAVDPLRRLAALGRAIPLGRLRPDRARLARRLRQREQTRKNAAAVADKGIDDITNAYLDVIRGLPAKPIVIGHSFGGLIAQKLLSGGAAAAAIAIDPGQIKGVKPLPFAQIRSGAPGAVQAR